MGRRPRLIIVDASVIVNALTDDGPVGQKARDELARDVNWAAPEHLRVEAFSAVRGQCLGNDIDPIRARDALDTVAEFTIELVNTAPLFRRMWQLRNNISGYNAAYVAVTVAEANACPLLTADVRLSRTAKQWCEVHTAVPDT